MIELKKYPGAIWQSASHQSITSVDTELTQVYQNAAAETCLISSQGLWQSNNPLGRLCKTYCIMSQSHANKNYFKTSKKKTPSGHIFLEL